MNEELTIGVVTDANPADPESIEALRVAVALAEEMAKEAKIRKLVAMKNLVRRLSEERDELIKAKRDIDMMMLDSRRIYRGDDAYNDATKAQPVSTAAPIGTYQTVYGDSSGGCSSGSCGSGRAFGGRFGRR